LRTSGRQPLLKGSVWDRLVANSPLSLTDMIDENAGNTTGCRLEYNPPCRVFDV